MRLLYLFHTLRHLTLRQLVYRLIRSVQRRLGRFGKFNSPARPGSGAPDGTHPAAGDSAGGARAPEPSRDLSDFQQLSLRPAPPVRSRITQREIVLLGSSYPIASPGAVDYAAPEQDALFRYLLSGQSFLLGEESEPEAVRSALLAAARALRPPTGHKRPGDPGSRPLLDPHPVSLRLINWVRLLSRPLSGAAPRSPASTLDFTEQELALLSGAIEAQLRLLAGGIEYETDGNHLIDNAVALISGGAYLVAGPGDPGPTAPSNGRPLPLRAGLRALRRGWELLRRELPKQLTGEGAHNEGSGVYHAVMLERVLDVLNVIENDRIRRLLGPERAITALRSRAEAMLAWALYSRWGEEELPPVNDALFGLAPRLSELEAYAKALGVAPTRRSGSASGAGPGGGGYRFWRERGVELLFDCAMLGAEHVPGHAHSDSLQLLLSLEGREILVDTGTSLYESGETRRRERSTAAHNSVVYGGKEQSEVWSSFRVARRAQCRALGPEAFTPAPEPLGDWKWCFGGEHDGYARYGVIHRRGVWIAPTGGESGAEGRRGVLIRDELLRPGGPGSRPPGSRPPGRKGAWGVAYFILAPEPAREIGPVAPSSEAGGRGPSGRLPAGTVAWQVDVGPVTFTFNLGPGVIDPGNGHPESSAPGAPTPESYALPRPRVEPWLLASGYRKQVETVRIGVPFFTLLETRIDER